MDNHQARASYQLPSVGMIRARELIENILPVSRVTLWRMIRDGRFPPPVRLTQKTSAWRVEDIRAWLQSPQK